MDSDAYIPINSCNNPIWKGIGKHINNIRKGSRLKFYGIDRIESHSRGSNLTQEISRNETRIFELGTLTPQVLNLELDANLIANY